MELEPIHKLVNADQGLVVNENMDRQLQINDELAEERLQIKTRLEDLRAQKYELVKLRNEQIRNQITSAEELPILATSK